MAKHERITVREYNTVPIDGTTTGYNTVPLTRDKTQEHIIRRTLWPNLRTQNKNRLRYDT